MSYLEELLPEFRKGAKIRRKSWQENFCISLNDCCGINIPYYDVEADDWELYQESTDWDYIIKNKCLCWFWDDDGDKPVIAASLIEHGSGKFSFFRSDIGAAWNHCRPVRRDEVTFYEDRKDE